MLRKDPTEFRERVAAYKNGKSISEIYEAGRPIPKYELGKDEKPQRRWAPNANTRRSIAKYEGDAMFKETIDPLSKKLVKKNAPFEVVTKDFVNAFSPELWSYVEGNDDLLLALYHYDYNVGAGKLKERTLPVLLKYYKGQASVEDVLNAMWAHGDKHLRGLLDRRRFERGLVGKALTKDYNPNATVVPYRNDDYNYHRANQLGYVPDETGHMPSRDYGTGAYLKSTTHPTVIESIANDIIEGYLPEYNKLYKAITSTPNPLTQWFNNELSKAANIQVPFLPGYELGKPGGTGLLPIDIPSVARNVYRAFKERAYRTITPQDYNISKATKEFISGKNRNLKNMSPAQNEEWARYLGVPYKGKSSFEASPYKPQKGKTYGTVLKFKDESEILSDEVLNQMLEHQRKTGKNSKLVDGNGKGLGSYTISLGEDEKGKYISYYDDWDINPFKGISSKIKIPVLSNIEDIIPGSNPFTVYGRRYYTNTRNEPRNK